MSTPAANRGRGKPPGPPQAGLFALVKPYKGLVATLATLTILANALNLVVPKLIASAIDNYRQPNFALGPMIARFLLVCVSCFPADVSAKPGADLRVRTRGEGPARPPGGEARHADL